MMSILAVAHHHIERRGSGAFFLRTVDVAIVVVDVPARRDAVCLCTDERPCASAVMLAETGIEAPHQRASIGVQPREDAP